MGVIEKRESKTLGARIINPNTYETLPLLRRKTGGGEVGVAEGVEVQQMFEKGDPWWKGNKIARGGSGM